MGVLALKEDRPTPKAVYNWRVYMCAAVASIAACMIGYDSAFIGGTLALPSFKSEFDFASYRPEDLALVQANIVSVYQAGAFFGSIMAFVTNFYLGRRKSLLIFVVVFTLGAGMMLGADKQRGLALIIVGRVLAGIGVGASSNVVPIYISEISPPAVRGRLVGIYELGWQIGGLVGFWINYGVSTTMAPSHTQWLIPFAVQLVPSGMLFFGALWMKESPRWLFSRGRREEAVQNLVWIRNLEADDIYMVEEIGYIDADLDRYTKEVGRGFWKPFGALSDPKIRWRFFLGAFMFLWQNGSGINAINYYSPTVFASIGIRGTNASLLTTGIFGVVKTSLTIVWLLWLIDQFGRRAMLLVGAVGGGLCMFYIGGYIALAGVSRSTSTSTSSESISLSPSGISAIFMFYLWTAFYTPSWNGTPWVLNSEMYDLNTRALGQAWAACNNWLWNFLISRFTPQMFLTMGFGVYLFFGSLMMISAVFVWFLVPETKSIPLEKMDRLFEIKPVWKANQLVMEELQLEDEQFRRNAGGSGVSTEKPSEERTEVA